MFRFHESKKLLDQLKNSELLENTLAIDLVDVDIASGSLFILREVRGGVLPLWMKALI
jgi:hypothetical protein